MELIPSYIECPKCGKWFRHARLLSYSIFYKSEYWSDGKCYNYDVPEYSYMPFSKCGNCNNFFWFDDCREIKEYDIREYVDDITPKSGNTELIAHFLKKNPTCDVDERNFNLDYPPSEYWDNLPEHLIPDFVQIIENKDNLSNEGEIYIRTKLWQHINDLVRFQKNPIIQHLRQCGTFKEIFNFKPIKYQIAISKRNKKLYEEYHQLCIQNLNRLLDLLKQTPENEGSNFTMIEIERELGNFSKAKSLIKSLNKRDRDNQKPLIRKSKSYIAIRSRKVFKIS
jgi:hypothetical protein